jgi:exopolysaccharide biosynthesis polyprenyl glycosylphosphotransferase
LACVVGLRVLWQACLRAAVGRGTCLERAMVLGQTAAAARAAAAALERRHHGRVRVAATAPFPGLPDSPGFGWIEDAVRDRRIDRILIADSARTRDLYSVIMPRLMRLDVEVTLMPQPDILTATPVRLTALGAAAAADGSVPQWPLDCGQAAAKRAFDLAVAVPTLLVAAPLMLVISALIKLDSPGPVLFTQKRIGLRGVTFQIWKFRTMYHDRADHVAARQTSRDDDRITRVGRFLRRTSLDELPQLFNVFRGDMSVVGPRPHALGMTVAGRQLHEMVDGYAQRYAIKPGITGWAQVNGCRGEIDSSRKLRRRVALDCHYIENWSLAADAWILVRTASLFAFDRHAY